MTHSEPPLTRVVFFQVQSASAKLARICETASAHFEKKERFLFFVEDAKASIFVDELLWKMPETSFLPHVVSEEETQEWIAITKSKKNVNGARVAFNLCPTPLLVESSFRIIYELEDLTAPNKQKLSSLRFDRYKEARFSIEARLSPKNR
jgi:DNA polymerase-3 subunit chi